MIAALYVETDGCYFGLPGVDPWEPERAWKTATKDGFDKVMAGGKYPGQVRRCEVRVLVEAEQKIQHGVSCVKVLHIGGGYLHGAADDSVYYVDGVSYCGRCHVAMGAQGGL